MDKIKQLFGINIMILKKKSLINENKSQIITPDPIGLFKCYFETKGEILGVEGYS